MNNNVTGTAFCEPSMEIIDFFLNQKNQKISATVGLGISLQPLVDQNLK